MGKYEAPTQDWAPVTLNGPRTGGRGGGGGGGAGGVRAGYTQGDAKFSSRGGPHVAAGGRTVNQQHKSNTMNHKKLDEDSENYRVQTVSHKLSTLIQKTRQKKGLTRKELAHSCQERETIIAEYENGKAIPNGQVIQKMERALGHHLTGQNAGNEIVRKPKKSAAKPAGKKA